METRERIAVYVRIVQGKTVCICPASKKGCRQNCERETVERDKFRGWEGTMRRDRFGH